MYIINEAGKAAVAIDLICHGKPRTVAQFTSDPAARQCWYQDAECAADASTADTVIMEIAGRYTRSGNPVTVTLSRYLDFDWAQS